MQQMLLPDGGVLVNLYVSRMSRAILSVYPLPCAATSTVLAEQVPILDQPTVSVTLGAALHDSGSTIQLTEPNIDEISETDAERFLEWVARVPDGIARMLLYAEHGRHHVASDDPCVRAAIEELTPGLIVLSTEELLRHWDKVIHPSEEQLRAALDAIEVVGNYSPAGETDAAVWWRHTMG